MAESVAAVVLDRSQEKVLILKRRDVAVWVLPGGGVDQGETPEEAMVREVAEETGLRVEVVRKVAEYSPINRLAKVTHLYECRILGGTLQTGEETREIGFFGFTELPELFFFVHRLWLRDFLESNGEVIKRSIDEVTYWALFKYLCCHPVQFFRFLASKLGFPINS